MTLGVDLADADSVCGILDDAAHANLHARCRRGSVDVIEAPGRLIATGDLHDNPVHFEALVMAANLSEGATGAPSHLTLHEVIHSDRLVQGMDFSHRALVRVAALKARHPELVHTLLANHELSQVVGSGILKHGIRVVDAFNDGVDYAFGEDAPRVRGAIERFIRSMPLALRCRTPRGDILCAHSVPDVGVMQRFDPSILERDLNDADYEPRRGSAHLMVWGRGYDADQLEDLVERWGVSMFILGHEHAEVGVRLVEPNAVVLNSDHERGVYLPIDLAAPPPVQEAVRSVIALHEADPRWEPPGG